MPGREHPEEPLGAGGNPGYTVLGWTGNAQAVPSGASAPSPLPGGKAASLCRVSTGSSAPGASGGRGAWGCEPVLALGKKMAEITLP